MNPKYFLGTDTYTWKDLIPGDSIVVTRRTELEVASIDAPAASRGDERVLGVARHAYQSHSGCNYLRVYVLSPSRGLCYLRRNLTGKPSSKDRVAQERAGGW